MKHDGKKTTSLIESYMNKYEHFRPVALVL